MTTTSNPIQAKFLRHLRKLRLQAGLRQSDVAAALGRPQSYVSKYESGEKTLDIFELIAICQVLNIPVVDIITWIEKKNES